MSLADFMDSRNMLPTRELKVLGAKVFRGSIVSNEANEWVGGLMECFTIIKCHADQQMELAETLLEGEAKEWWKTIKKRLSNEERQDLDMF